MRCRVSSQAMPAKASTDARRPTCTLIRRRCATAAIAPPKLTEYVHLSNLTGGRSSAMADWRLEGVYMKNCNCDPGCPCDFNADPTHHACEGMAAMIVEKGHFDGV